MSRKVGILGIGHVGASVAAALTHKNICNQIILVDQDLRKAEAEALDLLDTMPFSSSYTKIIGTDDLTFLAQADILINCVGPTQKLHENRLDELGETAQIVKDVFPEIMAAGFNGIIINVTNPCDVITALIQQITALPKSQVFGTGTALDSARLHAHLAMVLEVDPRRISGYVLGEHGDSQFVAWSTISIDSFPLKSVLAAIPEGQGLEFPTAEKSVRNAGGKIAKGKGYTNFGIAQTVAHIVDSLYNNTQTILPVSAYNNDLSCYIGSPVMLCKRGIKFSTYPKLTKREQQKMEKSALIIQEAVRSAT